MRRGVPGSIIHERADESFDMDATVRRLGRQNFKAISYLVFSAAALKSLIVKLLRIAYLNSLCSPSTGQDISFVVGQEPGTDLLHAERTRRQARQHRRVREPRAADRAGEVVRNPDLIHGHRAPAPRSNNIPDGSRSSSIS
jgi:hypothetical protein